MRTLLLLLLVASSARAGPIDAGAATIDPGAVRKHEPIPETGVDQAPRRGTYLETTLGVFTTLGGSQPLSNAQPYLGLTVGHELGEAVALFASLGIGASSASCFQVSATGNCVGADSFGATYLEVGASYGVTLASRLQLSGKLVFGLTNLSPAPVAGRDPVTGRDLKVADNLFGPHGGVGLGLDYDTHLDHFAVGVDALVRYSAVNRSDGSGTLGLASIALMPRVRYVF